MLVVAIDPGESTGLVFLDTRKKMVLFSTTVPIEEAYGIVSSSTKIEQIILEDMSMPSDYPSNAVIKKYFHMFTDLYNRIPVTTVKPGLWKPIAKARNWKFVQGKTGHEQDAFNMMRYWLLSVGRINLQDSDIVHMLLSYDQIKEMIL